MICKIDEPRVAMVRWVEPKDPLVPKYINGWSNSEKVSFVGGLLKTTVLGQKENIDLLPIAQSLADAMRFFAYTTTYYDLTQIDLNNKEYKDMARKYGLWILNYTQMLNDGNKFEKFKHELDTKAKLI